MATKSFFTKNSLAFVGISLIIYALVIGGLYQFVHAPMRAELADARREASASREEAERLQEELVARLANITDLESRLAESRDTSSALEATVREREDTLVVVQTMQTRLIETLQQEISSGQIRVERMLDSLRVDLVNEILFDSGESTLKPAGMEVLDRLGEVLEQATDRLIVVQGHTDSVRIGGRLAQTYPTNWELSAARAVNVTRYLQENVGIEPQRLSASAFSEYRPRADNSTQEGRQSNRRIEILLAPLPESSFATPIPVIDAE